MSLIVHEVALDMIRSVQPLMASIARHDRSLAVQIRRAASSVALNIAEAEYSDPGTKRSRFHTAAGSAAETRSALRVAACWRYIDESRADESLLLLDRVLRMLWPLTH